MRYPPFTSQQDLLFVLIAALLKASIHLGSMPRLASLPLSSLMTPHPVVVIFFVVGSSSARQQKFFFIHWWEHSTCCCQCHHWKWPQSDCSSITFSSSSTDRKAWLIVIIIVPLLPLAGANGALPVIFQQQLYSSSLLSFSPPPPPLAYYGWLLCVGQTGLDIIDIVIASQIIIAVIIVSLPSPTEERRAEMCVGERGRGGNCFGVNTAPSTWWGRVGKASKESIFISSMSIFSMFVAVILQQQHQLHKTTIGNYQCMCN
jgi:hypothetical protein